MEDLGVKPPAKKCSDIKCPWHGKLRVRRKALIGKVVSDKMEKSAVIEVTYLHYVRKYRRYERRRARHIVHVPPCIEVKKGDVVKALSTRRLSKTKSFVVVGKVEGSGEK